MSSRIPFKRVSAAFDEVARARLCQSSGSEHSAHNSAELSDLVNSFIEEEEQSQYDKLSDKEVDDDSDDQGSSSNEYYSKHASDSSELLSLRNLLGLGASDNDAKAKIRSQIELAYKNVQLRVSSPQEIKRKMMSQLRQRGFDAGVCKSRLKKIGHFPTGDYEYMDVMMSGTRYIVELNLAGEFTIARPSGHYRSLLQAFPTIFVGEPDELKQVVKLMCTAVKKSLKLSDMHLPSWRKNNYMLAKWFGTYKRTTNAVARMNELDSEVDQDNSKKVVVGFKMSVVAFEYKRVELGKKVNFGVGNLAQVLSG